MGASLELVEYDPASPVKVNAGKELLLRSLRRRLWASIEHVESTAMQILLTARHLLSLRCEALAAAVGLLLCSRQFSLSALQRSRELAETSNVLHGGIGL